MTDVSRVAILSPGDMGSAVGNILHQGGIDVLSCLAGRSELTRSRAAACGFRDVATIDDLVREAEVILSILVPSEATAIAESVAEAIKRTGASPVFVECNAIAPATVGAIERLIHGSGGGFIDAGIIGGPPKAANAGARFYCSGPDTSAFEALTSHGLDIRVVGPGVGQASGLKMVFAASTKGTQAVWTELLTAARAMGLADALFAEWGPNNATAKQTLGSLPNMPSKSRRWVGEMEEIAATFAALGLTPKIFEGAADIYRFVGDTPLAEQTPDEPNPTIEQMLETLAASLDTGVVERPA